MCRSPCSAWLRGESFVELSGDEEPAHVDAGVGEEGVGVATIQCFIEDRRHGQARFADHLDRRVQTDRVD